VFLAYASSKGRALIDRELYVPTSWTEDPDRCAKAGVPAECCTEGGFAAKPQLGVAMLNRAYQADALTSRSWLTADEAYGQNPGVRGWLADREIPYVLATRSDDLLTSPDGHRRPAKVLATSGERLIPLSANEIRRLLAKLALTPVACTEQVLHRSRWRRKRQFQARACHYRRCGDPMPHMNRVPLQY
jgi:SRSO17 transposase